MSLIRMFGRATERKLKDVRGDSLVESLVAILIAALGTAALATMVMAATSSSVQTQTTLERTYAAESAVTDSAASLDSVTIKAGAAEMSVKVDGYRSDDDLFVRYEDRNGESG